MHTTAPPGHHWAILADLLDAAATRASAVHDASVSIAQTLGGDRRHHRDDRATVTTPLGATASTIEAATR